jgi:hypothetical protein
MGGTIVAMVVEYQPLPLPHDMPSQWPDEPTIVEMAVPADFEKLLLSRRARAHLLVLPRAVPPVHMTDEWTASKAIYDRGDITAADALGHEGVSIAVLHDPEERNDVVQLTGEIVVALGLFVAQSLAEHEIVAIYEYVKSVIGRVRAHFHERDEETPVVLSIDLLKVRTVAGAEVIAKRISGPAEPTADLLLEVIREANRSTALPPGSTTDGE